MFFQAVAVVVAVAGIVGVVHRQLSKRVTNQTTRAISSILLAILTALGLPVLLNVLSLVSVDTPWLLVMGWVVMGSLVLIFAIAKGSHKFFDWLWPKLGRVEYLLLSIMFWPGFLLVLVTKSGKRVRN